ncbi:MAG: ferredoxin family protein [Candidatus Eisenbacteria bacterium]|nr:ferredoxin family protein [Candidatus Eisenbacteria bacterium]
MSGEPEERVPKRAWNYPARDAHPSDEIFIYAPWCKSCGICVAFCPAGVFTASRSGRPLVTNPDKCIVCGLCEMMCPDMAITVHKERKKAGGEKGEKAPKDGDR